MPSAFIDSVGRNMTIWLQSEDHMICHNQQPQTAPISRDDNYLQMLGQLKLIPPDFPKAFSVMHGPSVVSFHHVPSRKRRYLWLPKADNHSHAPTQRHLFLFKWFDANVKSSRDKSKGSPTPAFWPILTQPSRQKTLRGLVQAPGGWEIPSLLAIILKALAVFAMDLPSMFLFWCRSFLPQRHSNNSPPSRKTGSEMRWLQLLTRLAEGSVTKPKLRTRQQHRWQTLEKPTQHLHIASLQISWPRILEGGTGSQGVQISSEVVCECLSMQLELLYNWAATKELLLHFDSAASMPKQQICKSSGSCLTEAALNGRL